MNPPDHRPEQGAEDVVGAQQEKEVREGPEERARLPVLDVDDAPEGGAKRTPAARLHRLPMFGFFLHGFR